MSLITDTLNKMKKEQDSGENDDKMMAPPVLRNAVVNTKKYQEFIKNAEIKDINGHKAPLKGFVIVSIVLVTVIVIATIFFINKEDDTLIKQASIVSNTQTNQKSDDTITRNTNESLGRPYGSNEPFKKVDNANTTNVSGNNQHQLQQGQLSQKENIDSNNTMSSMPDSSKISKSKPQNDTLKQGPINVIPANQLFVIPVSNSNSVDNATMEQSSMQNDLQKPIPTKMNSEDEKIFEYTRQQVAEEREKAINNAKEIEKNILIPQQTEVFNKNIQKNYVSQTDIKDVKAIKTKDPIGTVSASTISLYNQYVTTGNKAKNEGSYEKAIEYYVNALALNKNDILSANIANMYLELKNPNMAFQIVITNGMKDTQLISALVVRMVNAKYFLESNKLLQYANTLDKSSYILFANGYYAQAQNNFDGAVKYYKDALTINPSDVHSAYYAALCYEEQGKNSEAIEMYKYIVNNSASSVSMKNQAEARVKKLGS